MGLLKIAVGAAAAVVAWKYVVQPWRARRAATRIVRVGKAPAATSAMKLAIDDIYAKLAKLKVSGEVGSGTHDGEPAVVVKPTNRALRAKLMDLLPDFSHGVKVAVV